MPRRLLVLATAVLLSAGCTAATSAATPEPGQPVTSTLPVDGPTDRAPGAPVTLAFAGDVHFDAHVARVLDGDDGLAELRPLLGSADLAMVNLESAITERGVPQPKLYHFRTSPQALTTLASAGVDVVSMANNHAVDFGAQGLADTLAARSASPIPVVGIGATAADAFAPAIRTVGGVRVAFLASTQIDDFTVAAFPATADRAGVAGNLASNDRLLAAVASARASADVVVVFMHWGIDYQDCPDTRSIQTATLLERAGADVVVGGHAHRVQGAGWLGRAYVAYGLGNFVWANRRGEPERRSGVLTVTVDPALATGRASAPTGTSMPRPVVTAAQWTPLRIADADGIPRRAADEANLSAQWERSRGCTRLRGSP